MRSKNFQHLILTTVSCRSWWKCTCTDGETNVDLKWHNIVDLGNVLQAWLCTRRGEGSLTNETDNSVVSMQNLTEQCTKHRSPK
jgi:hypothetical protein